MEITYHLTKEDYLHFNVFHLKHSKTAERALKRQRLIGPVIFLIYAFIFSKISGEPFLGLFITFLIISILWYLFYPKYFYNRVNRRVKKAISNGENIGVVGEHHLVITAEGLTESNAVGEMKINWSGVQDIKEDSEYFFVYNSTVGAFLIPKRDLANVDEVRNHLRAK